MKELAENFNRVIKHFAAYRDDLVGELERLAALQSVTDSDRQELMRMISLIKGPYGAPPEPSTPEDHQD